MAVAANVDRGYLDYAREKFSEDILPAIKSGAIALAGGLKTASVVVISGVGGQILAKNITQSGPSSATFEHALEKGITIGESLQEFEIGIGRVAAVAALSILTAVQLSKEASFVNRMGFTTIGIATFSILLNTQILGRVLSYLSGETINPVDTLGRNLPTMTGITIDPLVCQLALSTAAATVALSTRVYEKLISFIMYNYVTRGHDNDI